MQTGMVDQAERDLMNALEEHFRWLMNYVATRLQLDDLPTVRSSRLVLGLANS